MIQLLNSLLQLRGYHSAVYELASKEIKEPTLSTLFTRLAQTANTCQNELRYEIRKLGGIPIQLEQGSTVVVEKSRFLRLAILRNNCTAILESSECEGKLSSKTYESILTIQGAEELQIELLQKQYTKINEDLHMIRNLRKAFRI